MSTSFSTTPTLSSKTRSLSWPYAQDQTWGKLSLYLMSTTFFSGPQSFISEQGHTVVVQHLDKVRVKETEGVPLFYIWDPETLPPVPCVYISVQSEQDGPIISKLVGKWLMENWQFWSNVQRPEPQHLSGGQPTILPYEGGTTALVGVCLNHGVGGLRWDRLSLNEFSTRFEGLQDKKLRD